MISTVTIILVNDFRASRSSRVLDHVDTDAIPLPPEPVDWKSLPWTTSQLKAGDAIKQFPIEIHGTVTSNVSSFYSATIPDFRPRWAQIEDSLFSGSGHVVHKLQPYPPSNPLFSSFDRQSLASLQDENVTFRKLVPIQAPPDLHPIDSLLYALPLFLTISGDADPTVRYAVPRRFVEFDRLFTDAFIKKFNISILHEVWAVAQQLTFTEVPDAYQIPISAIATLKSYIDEPNEDIQRLGVEKCLLVPHNGKERLVSEVVAKLRFAGAKLFEGEPFIDPLVTIELLKAFQCSIGFSNRYLQLAAFMKSGSTVIEIQRPDVVSKAVLVAAGLGMKVHVFVDNDGVVDVEGLKKVLDAAVQPH
jgi:hypothetical protein